MYVYVISKGSPCCGLSTNQLKITHRVDQGDAPQQKESVSCQIRHYMRWQDTWWGAWLTILHSQSTSLSLTHISSHLLSRTVCQFVNSHIFAVFFFIFLPRVLLYRKNAERRLFIDIVRGNTCVMAGMGRRGVYCRPQQCNLMPVSVPHVCVGATSKKREREKMPNHYRNMLSTPFHYLPWFFFFVSYPWELFDILQLIIASKSFLVRIVCARSL